MAGSRTGGRPLRPLRLRLSPMTGRLLQAKSSRAGACHPSASAGVTPHGETAEAPYSRLGSRTAAGSDQRSRLVVLDEPSPAQCGVISSRRTDHFGISPQPSTTSHRESGVSTVFPCGRRPRSIRTPTPPHGTTRPATVSHSPASIEQRGGTIPVLRPNSTDGWHLFARGGRFRAEDGGRVHPGP